MKHFYYIAIFFGILGSAQAQFLAGDIKVDSITFSDATPTIGAEFISGQSTVATPANDDQFLLYDDDGDAIGKVSWSSVVATASGTAVALDLADDGADESNAILEIAITNDGASIASEPSADKLLLDFTNVGVATGDTWTGVHDFGGATSVEIPNGAAPTVNAAGEMAIDTTITDYTGLIKYYDGTEELTVIAVPTANLSTVDGDVLAYNATNNELEMVATSTDAPTDAEYLVQAANGTLSAEHVIGAMTENLTIAGDDAAGRTITLGQQVTNADTIAVDVPTANFTVDGSRILSTADEGTGNGLDADTLDGVEGDAYVKEADASTASMSFVLDEDTMASDSATQLATQQSIKAYVDSNSVSNRVKEIFFPAAQLNDDAVAPPGSATYNPAGGADWSVKEFDDTTLEGVWYHHRFPDDWDQSSFDFKIKVYWIPAGASSGTCRWEVQTAEYGDGDSVGSFSATQVTIDDTATSAGTVHVSPAGTVTAENAADDDMVMFRIYRDAGDASDTMTGDARLFGIAIQYEQTAAGASAW